MAPVLAVNEEPINSAIFSLKMRASVLLLAMSGFDPSSSTRTRIARPLTPPASLRTFSASRIPLRSAWPRAAPGPVRHNTTPIVIGSFCCASADVAKQPAASELMVPIRTLRRVVSSVFMNLLPCYAPASMASPCLNQRLREGGRSCEALLTSEAKLVASPGPNYSAAARYSGVLSCDHTSRMKRSNSSSMTSFGHCAQCQINVMYSHGARS
jgi:hypothetical protein